MFSDKGSVCSDCYSASTVLREYVLDKTPEIRLHFRCRVIDGAKWGQLMGWWGGEGNVPCNDGRITPWLWGEFAHEWCCATELV